MDERPTRRRSIGRCLHLGQDWLGSSRLPTADCGTRADMPIQEVQERMEVFALIVQVDQATFTCSVKRYSHIANGVTSSLRRNYFTVVSV